MLVVDFVVEVRNLLPLQLSTLNKLASCCQQLQRARLLFNYGLYMVIM